MREPQNVSGRVCATTAAALVVVVAALSGCERRQTGQSGPAQAAVPTVTVVRAGKMNVPLIGHPTGNTRALNEVTIRARVKGFLQEKNFTEGQNVKRGQLLLVIDEKPFQVRVQQAKAAIEEADAALKKAKETKSREIAAAQVALDETQMKLDEIEERRERSLLARKAASQEDYDRAKAKSEKSKAQVAASKASLAQALSDYDINILAAQAKVDQARADLDAAQIDLSYCRMTAPIDGRIGELQVKLGNLVGPAAGVSDTTSLVTIQQLDPMGVDLRPASRYLPFITRLVQGKAPFTLRIQGQMTHAHEGRLTFVDNTVDPTTSTVLVKGELPNPDKTLLPGEYVKVDLTVGDYAGGIVVPEETIVETQEGFRVLIVDDQDQVKAATVKPLDTYRGLAVLESGVNEGQRVIAEGIQFARPGQKVQVQEADLKHYTRPEATADEVSPLDSPLIRIRGVPPDASNPRPTSDSTSPEGGKPEAGASAPPSASASAPASEKNATRPAGEK